MSGLQLAYTFNDANGVPGSVRDYSDNQRNSSSLININYQPAVAPLFGYNAEFYASFESYIRIAYDVSTYSSLTIIAQIKIGVLSGTHVICEKAGSFKLYLDVNGRLYFRVYYGDPGNYSVASTNLLSTGTDYHIAAVWDGTRIYLFINGVIDANTTAASFSLLYNIGANDLFIGNDAVSGGNWFKGQMNVFEIRNVAVTAGEVYQLYSSPGGCLFDGDNHFAVGDLITDDTQNTQMIVTWVPSDKKTFYAYPISGAIGSDDYYKIGNCWNTLRQNVSETYRDFDGNENDQQRVITGVTRFQDYTDADSSNTETWDYTGIKNINGTNFRNVYSGTYTPTISSTSNVSSSTTYVMQYMRVGMVVSVSGRIDIDPTTTGVVSFYLTVPITTNFTNVGEQAGGSGASVATGTDTWAIQGNPGSSLIYIVGNTSSASNHAINVHYTYLIQ